MGAVSIYFLRLGMWPSHILAHNPEKAHQKQMTPVPTGIIETCLLEVEMRKQLSIVYLTDRQTMRIMEGCTQHHEPSSGRSDERWQSQTSRSGPRRYASRQKRGSRDGNLGGQSNGDRYAYLASRQHTPELNPWVLPVDTVASLSTGSESLMS